MKKKANAFPLAGLFVLIALTSATWPVFARMPHTGYPSMAPIGQYLMSGMAEIALARSAAPPSISDDATVMILGRDEYRTVAKGTNGFLCLVERSWGNDTGDPEFWNPKIRAPICFNQAAAQTSVPTYLLKTKLALAGKSNAEIADAIASSFREKKLPALEPGAMAYMLSRQQYLPGADGNWHPHLMFFVSGNVVKSWGANLHGSPVIATSYPEDRITTFMVWVDQWSDGTLASQVAH